jgi:hypothetical protein
VIAVAVRQRQPVEAAHAKRPQGGRDDAATDVERPGRAARVHEQRVAVRRLEQHRFTLSDVDHGDP